MRLDGATSLKFALQAVQRGTGHAALCAMECVAADFDGDVIITYGDMPRLRAATISAFIGAHRQQRRRPVFHLR